MIVPVEESEEERSTVVISSEGGDQGEESIHLDLDSEASEAPDLPRDTTQEGATVAAVAQGEQVRRGPQGPPGGLSPEVVAACTRAHLVDMGVVPSISGRPPVSEPAPFSSFSSSCPPAAGRSPGMSLEQWEAISAPSGGGQVRPSRPGRGSLQRRAVRSSTLSSTSAVPSLPTGGDAPGAAPSSGKALSSREKKKARAFIVWAPTQDQLMHAQLLLKGDSIYKMDAPICLTASDPRMTGVPLSKKWLCAYCAAQYSSQLDCQGHTLSAHSQVRSPSLCDCRVSTFNSAKALWDHLSLMHNIEVRRLKNEDPPAPWLKSTTRPTR